MSFLAAMFLLYMDEFTSFRCLGICIEEAFFSFGGDLTLHLTANMLEFPFFRALYKMDIAHVRAYLMVHFFSFFCG